MSWYKKSSVVSLIKGLYYIDEQELSKIFSSLWLELAFYISKQNEPHIIICKFKSPKLEGNMLMGTLKELEAVLSRIKGVTKVKSKLFDYTVEIMFDKEVII